MAQMTKINKGGWSTLSKQKCHITAIYSSESLWPFHRFIYSGIAFVTLGITRTPFLCKNNLEISLYPCIMCTHLSPHNITLMPNHLISMLEITYYFLSELLINEAFANQYKKILQVFPDEWMEEDSNVNRTVLRIQSGGSTYQIDTLF